MHEEVAALRELLEGVAVPPESRETLLWCVNQLPRLYQELDRTCESRYEDEIVRLTEGILMKLSGPEAERVREHLLGMHSRLGFGVLNLKVIRPAARGRKTG